MKMIQRLVVYVMTAFIVPAIGKTTFMSLYDVWISLWTYLFPFSNITVTMQTCSSK